MRMIANQTKGWQDVDVYLDGAKLDKYIEADDDLGKIWIDDPSEYTGYKVLYGRVEFKTKPKPEINFIETSSGLYSNFNLCNSSDDIVTLSTQPHTIPESPKYMEYTFDPIAVEAGDTLQLNFVLNKASKIIAVRLIQE